MKIVEVARVRGQQYTLTLLGEEEFEVTVDAATFDDSWYYVNGEISPEQLEALLEQSRYNRARSRALYYLSDRDYGAKELERKLYRCADKETAAKVVARLTEVGLVNDGEYAKRQAHSLLTYKQYPKRRILQALQQKGISRTDAENALEELEPDDFQQALALIRKKYYNRVHDKVGREKTAAALARYGFSYDAVRRAINAVTEEQIDDEWD